jgi:hypothetical protein
MKAHRRIILREIAIAAGLFTATWYAFYLVGIWTTLDYFEEGPFLDYVTSPAIHAEILISGLGLGAILGLVSHLFEGTGLRLRPFGQIILIKSSLYCSWPSSSLRKSWRMYGASCPPGSWSGLPVGPSSASWA